MKEKKLAIRTSYTILLFVNSDNNFITFFRAFIAWCKPKRTFGSISEQITENPRYSRGFLTTREFSQTLPTFSPGNEGTDRELAL